MPLAQIVTQPHLEGHSYVAYVMKEEKGVRKPNFSVSIWKEKKRFLIFNKFLFSQCLYVTAFVEALNEYLKFSFFSSRLLKLLSYILISGFVHSNNPVLAILVSNDKGYQVAFDV